MSVERARSATSLVDVLDRVLDKGIVMDAWVRVSLGGVDLLQVEARIVVASIDTYLTHAPTLAGLNLLSPPLSIESGRSVTRGPVRRRPQVRARAA